MITPSQPFPASKPGTEAAAAKLFAELFGGCRVRVNFAGRPFEGVVLGYEGNGIFVESPGGCEYKLGEPRNDIDHKLVDKLTKLGRPTLKRRK